MKRLLAGAFSLIAAQAAAQSVPPAQMGMSRTVPQSLEVLDSGGYWALVGTVDPTTHTFTVSGGSSSGGSPPAGATNSIQTNGGSGVFGSLPNPLPVANGGTGTATPCLLVSGTGISISGCTNWPNQTITVSGGTGSGTINAGTINQIPYYAAAGTTLSGLGPGTSGQVLTSNGAGAAPTFQTLSGGTGSGTVNSGTANQTAIYPAAGTTVGGVGPGTTGQVLTSNGSGSPPSFQTPTTGSGTVNSGTINQMAFYAAAGAAVSGVGPGTTGQVLTSNGAGAPPTFQTPASGGGGPGPGGARIVVTRFPMHGKIGGTVGSAMAAPVCPVQGCTPGGAGWSSGVVSGANATVQLETSTTTPANPLFVCGTAPIIQITTNSSGIVQSEVTTATQGDCTIIGAIQDQLWMPAPGSTGVLSGSGLLIPISWVSQAQTWTPASASTLQYVRVFALGGGAQGGGGAMDANATTSASGGAGGGAAAGNWCEFQGASVGSSQVVGAGPGGRSNGVPGNASGANGQPGGDGVFSQFGGTIGSGTNALCIGPQGKGSNAATAGQISTVSTGGGGAGQLATSAGTAGGLGGGGAGGAGLVGSPATAYYAGGGGGGGSITGGNTTGGAATQGGGGAGGGLTTAGVAQAGQPGGTNNTRGVATAAPTAGAVGGGSGTPAGNGGNGAPIPGGVVGPGVDGCSGASGGGSNTAGGQAGNGGYGCGGAGGGGGGSSIVGAGPPNAQSGFGGPGGDGEVFVMEYY